MEEFTDRIDELNTVEYVDFFISPEQDEKMMRNALIDLGKEEGKAEGKEEGKRELAKNLLEKGVSKDIIASSLNIMPDELEEYLK